MTDVNAKTIMAKIYDAETPAAVDAAFAPLAEMKPAARRKAIDAVEAEFLADFRAEFPAADLPQIKLALNARNVIEDSPLAELGGLLGDFMAAVGLVEEEPQEDRRVAEDLMTASQVFFNIHKLKGNKADPLVKTFVTEAAKLSDTEYASAGGQTKLLIKLLESEAVAAPAPVKPRNPFRPS